jgi:hypothetical protein
MQISREKHMQYMARLIPLLFLALIVQTLLYFHFFPRELASDITVFLAGGLCLLILAFGGHNLLHEVHLRSNYLEIKVRPLGLHQEIFYRDIVDAEVTHSRHGYSSVRLVLRDGREVPIYYIDEGENFLRLIGAPVSA